MACTHYCVKSGQRVTQKRALCCASYYHKSNTTGVRCGNCAYSRALTNTGKVPHNSLMEYLSTSPIVRKDVHACLYGVEVKE